MSELVTGIGELCTLDPQHGEGPLGIRRDAALVLERGRVAWIGAASEAPDADWRTDVEGAAVVPGFVDSHSHLVFAGDRSAEFAARMAGKPYAAGGIRTTVAATRAADEAALVAATQRLLDEALRSGTTTMEIKSGYGLEVATEARSLRIAAQFTEETTFLGAHVVPAEYVDRRDEYVRLVCGPMLTAAAPHATWIDAFCERGAFTAEESRAVLESGRAAGLGLRLHANQLSQLGGIRLAVELDAASVDHCTVLEDADVDALAGSATVPTFLPGAEFSTRQPYPRVERLRAAGVRWAIASDCNPGSSYTTSMPFAIALAVREMGATPEEALVAATLGGAAALRRPELGRIVVGGPADLVQLRAPSHLHLAYRPGVHLVERAWKGGRSDGRWPRRGAPSAQSQ